MTPKEFYDAIGGDYADALSRLMNDTFIIKFIGKFKDDKNYGELKKCIENGDFDNAFSYSHTFKGVALNLSFKRLSEAAVNLTDALRKPVRNTLTQERAEKLLAEVTKEYITVTENIKKLCD